MTTYCSTLYIDLFGFIIQLEHYLVIILINERMNERIYYINKNTYKENLE